MAVRDGVAEILNGKAPPDRDFPRVHGRAGQPCPRCGTTIVKARFAGRGTYTCPSCQPDSTPLTSGASPDAAGEGAILAPPPACREGWSSLSERRSLRNA